MKIDNYHNIVENDMPPNEVEKTILFAIAMKIIKYLRINLIKDVKNNLYNKNYKNY